MKIFCFLRPISASLLYYYKMIRLLIYAEDWNLLCHRSQNFKTSLQQNRLNKGEYTYSPAVCGLRQHTAAVPNPWATHQYKSGPVRGHLVPGCES